MSGLTYKDAMIYHPVSLDFVLVGKLKFYVVSSFPRQKRILVMIPGDPCGSCLFCWGHCSVTVVVIVKGPATNAIDDGCCSYRCRVPKTVYNTEE